MKRVADLGGEAGHDGGLDAAGDDHEGNGGRDHQRHLPAGGEGDQVRHRKRHQVLHQQPHLQASSALLNPWFSVSAQQPHAALKPHS